MRNRGDNHRLLSRIAAAGRSGWAPRSSQTGFTTRLKPAKRKPAPVPAEGSGCRRKNGIRSWRAE